MGAGADIRCVCGEGGEVWALSAVGSVRRRVVMFITCGAHGQNTKYDRLRGEGWVR